jgi:hypothetical protein
MSELTELKEISSPNIQVFKLMNGKEARIGPLSLQFMLDIEEKYGDFNEWSNRVTDPTRVKITDVCDMMYGLLINKEDFDNDPKQLLRGFPARIDWIEKVKGIMLDVIVDSVDTAEPSEGGDEKK